MKTVFYTAVSMDGFLATEDDGIDWLDVHGEHEDTYTPFIANVGAICMGSATYAFIQRHVAAGNPWPYTQPTWVFTSQELEAVPGADIRLVRGDVQPHHKAMVQAAEGKDVWVCGGGGLAAKFHEAGLLDELVLTVAGSTLGAGKPLMPIRADWKLTSARAVGPGFAELRYVPA